MSWYGLLATSIRGILKTSSNTNFYWLLINNHLFPQNLIILTCKCRFSQPLRSALDVVRVVEVLQLNEVGYVWWRQKAWPQHEVQSRLIQTRRQSQQCIKLAISFKAQKKEEKRMAWVIAGRDLRCSPRILLNFSWNLGFVYVNPLTVVFTLHLQRVTDDVALCVVVDSSPNQGSVGICQRKNRTGSSWQAVWRRPEVSRPRRSFHDAALHSLVRSVAKQRCVWRCRSSV